MEKKIFSRKESLKVAVAIMVALIGLTIGIAALTGEETTILPGILDQNVATTIVE